ncbi:hypothetical protein RFI_25234 [Reticulomyxa filosa]|uniref:Exportin-T n=1 Tax=Reticulomyxa filosa TaxID=46433 RepID=X6ME15_RETFI|nr:hypothetical protein RFI_25234 [Reticulomyxa filosa]|eukprot:ETO12144.1 hypothetical protein RFI_25234 [Reticulomyxa filosa]
MSCEMCTGGVDIKKKVAQVLVDIAKKQYPEQWPSFFVDMIKILQDKQTPHTAQMFFGILKELNWSIVENHNQETKEEMARNVIIKDAMREKDLERIITVWHTFLSLHKKTPVLTKICLETMDGYISWIGIELIANETFLSLLYQFLKDDKLQCPVYFLLYFTFFFFFGKTNAADCLYEIISKRMDFDKKYEMLKGIDILRVVVQTEAYNKTDAFNMTLVCYEASLRYFAHPDYKVSAEVVDFFIDFWNMINHRHEMNHKEKLQNEESQQVD